MRISALLMCLVLACGGEAPVEVPDDAGPTHLTIAYPGLHIQPQAPETCVSGDRYEPTPGCFFTMVGYYCCAAVFGWTDAGVGETTEYFVPNDTHCCFYPDGGLVTLLSGPFKGQSTSCVNADAGLGPYAYCNVAAGHVGECRSSPCIGDAGY